MAIGSNRPNGDSTADLVRYSFSHRIIDALPLLLESALAAVRVNLNSKSAEWLPPGR